MPQPDLLLLWSSGCDAPPSVYALTGCSKTSVDDSSKSRGLPTSTSWGRPRSQRCCLNGVSSRVTGSC
eukprot:648390-Heterocapsa_arctica.AAC.1